MKELNDQCSHRVDKPEPNVTLPAPLGRIQPAELQDVVDVLNATTRHPATCISKKQMQKVAEQALAKCAIAEQRLMNVAVAIVALGTDANQLPEGSLAKVRLNDCYETLVRAINGKG